MKTEVFKLTGNELDQYLINIAGGKIRSGGLVAFPTETVYGLGANALDREAVNRIFKAKGRPFSDPLIVHICNIKQLEILTITLPLIAWQLAEAFWPGPLTLVLHRNAKVPRNISAERDSIAIRFPAHPVAQMLIKQSEVPIAAPSANRFMRPSPTTAQHVIDDLEYEALRRLRVAS